MIIKYTHENKDIEVEFKNDAFFNASLVARQFSEIQGKRREVGKFLSSIETKQYIESLIKYLSDESGYQISRENLIINHENGNEKGIWFHPKLAIAFARFLDVSFALWCDLQIEKILHGRNKKQIEMAQEGAIKEKSKLTEINERIKEALEVAKNLGYTEGQAIRFANQCITMEFDINISKTVAKFINGDLVSLNKLSEEIGQTPAVIIQKLKLIKALDSNGKLTDLGKAYAKEVPHGEKERILFYSDITDLLK